MEPASFIDGAAGATTVVDLDVAITQTGPEAEVAAFGMTWGHTSQLEALEELLA